MSMAMSLSDFSLLKEDGESYTVGHPKGKSITVPKRGLSSKAQQLISKMKREQRFDEGGGAEATDSSSDSKKIPFDQLIGKVEEPTPDEAPYGSGAAPISEDQAPDSPAMIPVGVPGVDRVPSGSAAPMPGMTAEQEGAVAQGSPSPASPSPASPAGGSVSLIPDISKALDTERASVAAGVKAEQTMGDEQAKAQRESVDQQKKAPSVIDTFNKNETKDKVLEKAAMDAKIDPNRYFHNQSTGAKVGSAIAMILSGIGAGLTGQPNMAMQIVNSHIDRDIEAQKNDQAKAMTLWKMNREHTNSEQEATLMTQNQMLAITKGKILAAAAKAQGPMAAARAAPILSQIDQQKAQNSSNLALLGQASSGGMSEVDPSLLVPRLVPKEHQAKAFEEIGHAQNIARNYADIKGAFKEAANDNTIVNSLGGIRTPGSVLKLHGLMLPNFKNVDGTVRQAAMDEMFKNVTPMPGDGADKIRQKGITLDKWLHSETAAPFARGFGINTENYRSTSTNPVMHFTPQEATFYNWAKAHPNDPKAQATLQRLGVQ